MDCENSGWGNINQDRPVNNPDELQVVVTPAISQAECKEKWEPTGKINDGNICSGGKDKGPCNVRFFLNYILFLLQKRKVMI